MARAWGGGADGVNCSCRSPNLGTPSGQAERGPPDRTCSADTSRGQHQGVGVGEVGVGPGQQQGLAESSLSPRSKELGGPGADLGPLGRGRSGGRGLSPGLAGSSTGEELMATQRAGS